MNKPIRLSGHARDQIARRGVTESEVIEAIQTASWQPAELGRLDCRKEFSYGKAWNGKFYKTSSPSVR